MNRRVALVTGGARGIGLGISRRLAQEGFDLAVCGTRAEADVDELAGLRAAGGQVVYVRADVGSAGDRERLVREVGERFGSLHLLVNNAGVAPRQRADLLDAEEESFERLVRINLEGPHFLTREVARFMVEQRRREPRWRGSIVFVTSVSATMASVDRGDYCISKAGLSMAARLWAARLASESIAVYEVRPGIVRTDMTAGVATRYDTLIEAGLVPEGRWGEPDDVGRTVAALARGDLPFAAGSVVTVDGGLSIPRL